MQQLPLKILRDDENAADVARMDFALRVGEVGQHHGDRDVGCGIDHAREITACLRAVAIDHRDRHIAQRLVQIRLRIEQRVERRTDHHHGERRPHRKDTAEFAAENVEKPAHDVAPAIGCEAAPASLLRAVRFQLSSRHAQRPTRPMTKAVRIRIGRQERSIGVPRTV